MNYRLIRLPSSRMMRDTMLLSMRKMPVLNSMADSVGVATATDDAVTAAAADGVTEGTIITTIITM